MLLFFIQCYISVKKINILVKKNCTLLHDVREHILFYEAYLVIMEVLLKIKKIIRNKKNEIIVFERTLNE